jgi:hypothetical protein
VVALGLSSVVYAFGSKFTGLIVNPNKLLRYMNLTLRWTAMALIMITVSLLYIRIK